MSFTESNLSVVGGESSEGPTIYTYLVPGGDDPTANFYFDSKYDTFKANDQIWIDTNGTIALLRVTSSGPALSDGVDVDVSALRNSAGSVVSLIDTAGSSSSSFTLYGKNVPLDGVDGRGKWIRSTNNGNTTVNIVDDATDEFGLGDFIYIKKIGASGSLTIEGDTGAATFDEASSIVLASQYDAVMIVCVEPANYEWEVFGI